MREYYFLRHLLQGILYFLTSELRLGCNSFNYFPNVTTITFLLHQPTKWKHTKAKRDKKFYIQALRRFLYASIARPRIAYKLNKILSSKEFQKSLFTPYHSTNTKTVWKQPSNLPLKLKRQNLLPPLPIWFNQSLCLLAFLYCCYQQAQTDSYFPHFKKPSWSLEQEYM